MTMPQKKPLYPPFTWKFPQTRLYSVICEIDESKVTALVPEPLLSLGQDTTFVEFFFAHFERSPVGAYKEAGLIVPVKYKDVTGSSYIYMYLDNDQAICAGREMLGLPKKFGQIMISHKGARMIGEVFRNDVCLIKVDLRFDNSLKVNRLPSGPRIQVRDIPKAEGNGLDLRTVIMFGKHNQNNLKQAGLIATGSAVLELGNTRLDPLSELYPIKVIGAVYSILDLEMAPGKVLYKQIY